ncbi:MAG: recombinase family protein, partial [Gammaproteobacteria bacterium]|nr:recombinase family protein [Gammaproteobacteria bacterium]
MKTIAYIRISDAEKQESTAQLESIHRYAADKGYVITSVVEEHISGSKTDVTDRELSKHISSGHRII